MRVNASRLAIVLALASCNRLFGVGDVTERDAAPMRFFDAPVDAPFACPLPGGTLAFSQLVHQIAQDCSSYTQSEDGSRAVALCTDATYNHLVMESTAGGAFTPIPAIPGTNLADPRLTPEGDELFVVAPGSSFNSTIEAYRRDTTGAWQHAYTVDATKSLGSPVYLGTPTRGPRRRMMVSNYLGFMFELFELEFDATSGTIIHTYTQQELGAGLFFAPSLFPDGLRMYYPQSGQPMLYYERPGLDAVFMSPLQVATAPQIQEQFMTADCARLYFHSGELRSLFWVQQQ